MVDIQSVTAENRQGKKKKERKTKERKKEETTGQKQNGVPYWAAIKTKARFSHLLRRPAWK